MPTEQQRQTLEYFSRMADDWRSKAANIDPLRKFNVIAARNAYAAYVAQALPKHAVAVDVGCGTGELVCDLARMELRAIGVDFAPDMIRLSKEKAAHENIADAEFVVASIFEYEPPAPASLMVANGFIEYISLEEFEKFLAYAKTVCTPDGTLVLGSRNRLFNVYSLNAFTRLEHDLGTIDRLVMEATTIAEAKDKMTLLADLAKSAPRFPAPASHPSSTGIEVNVRHQYTPAELIGILKNNGWEVIDLYPVPYHAAPPRLKETDRLIHISLAEFFQQLGHGHVELVPSSSTFMVAARRIRS